MKNLLLKDISINNKGYYGIGASACNHNDLYPDYLRITDITDYGTIPSALPTSIDPNIYNDWHEYVLKNNDIVFARTGNSTGRSYFCETLINDTVFAGFLIKFSIDSKIVEPKYVKYYCQSNNYWNQIKSLFTGSTRANVNAEQYANLLIPIPKRDKQQHIVNTISSLLLKSF